MDGLITIIIFFIISSLFSGNKNQKKRQKQDLNNQMNTEESAIPAKGQISPNKNLLTEIRAARDKMLAETENIKNSQPSRSFEKKAQNAKNPSLGKKSDIRDNNKKPFIPTDHISEEGISADTDYIYKSDLELTDQTSPISVEQPKKLFENKTDIRRAIILKEVLDKPLSLRTGR